jgi:hypothetical protein
LKYENKCFSKIALLKFVAFIPFVSLNKIDVMRILCILMLFSPLYSAFGQIESGKVGKGTETKAGQKSILPNSSTMFYLGAGLNHSFRNLQSNKTPFGEPLGQRANEESIDVWTFHLGYRQTLSKHCQIDAGLNFDKFGEMYRFQDPLSDSAFTYTNRYAFIGLPIQFNLTFGQRLVFSLGGGIQPMLATSYKTEQEITDANKNVTTNSYSSLTALNGFGCNLLISAGINYRCNKNIGVYLQPTYSHGLINTFEKQAAYKHYTRGNNFKFGLIFFLKD